MMKRPRPIALLFVTCLLLACWLGMQAIHEAGHVLAAKLTGGRVTNVVLHPLTISRTELAENPHALVVCWAGPLLGVFGPLALWLIAVACRLGGAFVLRFFAAFCLVANGLYIGLGWLLTATDAADLVKIGEPHWRLWLFAGIAVPTGFALWNGQGGQFGIGPNAKPVDPRVMATTCAALAVLVVLGLLIGR
jgi:hypothetical protein